MKKEAYLTELKNKAEFENHKTEVFVDDKSSGLMIDMKKKFMTYELFELLTSIEGVSYYTRNNQLFVHDPMKYMKK